MNERRVAEVVETSLGENLRTGFEPDGFAKLNTAVSAEKLGSQATECSQHSPAGMDDFEFAVLGERLRIGGETGRVPAVVAREFTREVRGNSTLGERSEPQNAVRSVELGSGASHLACALRTRQALVDDAIKRNPTLPAAGTALRTLVPAKALVMVEEAIGDW